MCYTLIVNATRPILVFIQRDKCADFIRYIEKNVCTWYEGFFKHRKKFVLKYLLIRLSFSQCLVQHDWFV